MTNKKMIISACSIALSGVILLNAQTAHASDTNVTSESIQTTNSLSNSSTGTSSDAQSTTASNDNTTETASQNTQTSNETNAAGKTVEDIFKQTLDYNDSFVDYNNIKEINQTINYKDRTTGEEIAPSNNQTSSLVPWYDTKKVTLKYIVDNSSNNKNNPNAGQVIQTYDIYQNAGSTLQFDFVAVAKNFQDAVSTTPGIEGTNHWHVQDTSHLARYKINGDTSITIKVTPDTYDDGNSTTYANLPTSMYKTEKIANLDGAKKYYARVDGDNILREVRLSGNDINFYFNEVKSPYIKNYKLEDPNQLIIPANSQSLADGQSQIIDVYYQPVSTSSIVEEALPDTMVDFNSIKEVTQTINYKDKTTGKELASANIQTQSLVPYYQTSTVTIEIRSVDFTKIASGVGNINNLYEYAENYPLKDKVIQTYHITQPVGSTLQFDEQALGQELQSTSIHWSDPEIGGITYYWQLNSSFSDDNVKFTDSNQTVRLYIFPNVYSTVAPDPEGGKYADGFLYYPEVPNSLYKTENITNHVFAGGTPSYAIVKDNQIIKSGITNPADTNFEFEAVASPNIKNYQLVDTNQHTIPEASENAANAASRTIDVLYTQSGQSDTGTPLTDEVKPVANVINYVDPDGNPVKDPDGNPVTKKVSGNPGDPITLDLPKGFHFPNGKTPDITIDPDKPVVNIPVVKDLTDTGDPLSEGTKPVANVINYVDPDGNPVKDPDGNPVTKKVSGNPGDPITLDLPKGFHFPNGKTPDITIDPDKPVVNVPVIKDLTDTGDPLTEQVKPVANIINFVDPDGNPVKDPDGNPVTKRVSGNPGDPISLDLPKGFHFPNGKTPDITIDPDKPVVNVPVIKDLTDTGDPLVNETKPVANIINYVDPDGNPVKDPDGNPVTKKVSGNPGDPISLDLPKGFHFPDGKTPDISIDPDKPVVNVPVIKDLTNTGDPLSEGTKPVANVINYVDPDGNPVKDPDGNPVTKRVSGNPGDPISLDLPKGFHFPNGKTPDITIDPDKPVVNIPVIKDLTDTGDPLTEQVKPVANIINFVDPDGNPVKDPDGNPVTKKVSGNPGDPITLDLPKGFHFPNGKTPDIAIDPAKPVVNIPVIKDLTDTGDPLVNEAKPVANIINFVDPDGNPVKDPDGNPVTKKVSGNPGDPITLDLPKGFHFPNGKTPDIAIDPAKPVVNIPVIKDLTDTGDPLVNEAKPVANIINFVDPDGNPVKDPDGNPVIKKVSGNPGDPITLDLPKGFHFPDGKTPDIAIDPAKPVVNIPVIKDLTDTGDPLVNEAKPNLNIPIKDTNNSGNQKEDNDQKTNDNDKVQEPVDQININTPSIDLIQPTGKVTDNQSKAKINTSNQKQQEKLPQTGSDSILSTISLGFVSLLSALGLSVSKKRKN